VQGQILAEYQAGAWGYVLPDALGSVRQLVAAAGQVSLAQSYDPFGALMSQFTNFPVSQPFGYIPLLAQAGEWWDAEAALLYDYIALGRARASSANGDPLMSGVMRVSVSNKSDCLHKKS
jgi:hypothetical protein